MGRKHSLKLKPGFLQSDSAMDLDSGTAFGAFEFWNINNHSSSPFEPPVSLFTDSPLFNLGK